ncbi:M15 family peptidase [Fusobacterium ulcerans]|jgi:peptidoglycan L-alanyl-D-glutamate endopeptidase CwlK|uniref:M15 family metallopeptidase n=1 Tax=Fusobacterium ulcerans TaxID=861 RepID=UPI000E4FBD0F|nr:M15 family metallopeptidase [Fusobacterium ulcerans]RGY61952.1 M15 family peptidase [Fusobacterium ulcerans]
MYKFSKRSLDNLKGVDERLVKLMEEVLSISPYDFGITEGLRTIEKQKEYVRTGKSQTMNSYHLKGKAVDIVVYKDGEVTWDLKYYKEIANIVKETATEKGLKITWGGDWKTLVDGPHFQLEN